MTADPTQPLADPNAHGEQASPWEHPWCGVRPRLLQQDTVLEGGLEVRELVGEGGMGQVYAADDRFLNRRVAVKISWPDAGASVRAEAQAMAAIHHPSVVRVLSMGRYAGRDYAVMEFIRGETLEQRIDRRPSGVPFPVGDAIQLLASVSDGLAAVHRAGMAHCDVKPSNILLAPGDRVVLTDFGIFQPEIYANARGPAGSPAYMAPETIRGDVRRGEAYLVDVYALGLVAFELLAGEPPFSSDNVPRLLAMHLTHEPPRLVDLRPELPARLSSLVGEMLAKDPRGRPASMDEIAWRFRNVPLPRAAGRPVAAQRAPVCDCDPGPGSVGCYRLVVAERPTKPGERRRILIIEDHDETRELYEVHFEKAGYLVSTARNGKDGLVAALASKPDVVLLDLMMPVMDGWETVKQLRRHAPAWSMPVIACTAVHSADALSRAAALGCDGVIRKPCVPEDIEHAVKEALSRVPDAF